MMSAQTQAEVLPYLDAHVAAVHRGLQALMDLLAHGPPGRVVQASSLHALLAPLADEASQAEPLARRLADEGLRGKARRR